MNRAALRIKMRRIINISHTIPLPPIFAFFLRFRIYQQNDRLSEIPVPFAFINTVYIVMHLRPETE